MKIMFVDTGKQGHNLIYASSLISKCESNEKIAVFSQKIDSVLCKQYEVPLQKHNFFYYIKWLHAVWLIAKKENPDVIHFLTGDIFYRFFGLGLKKFKKFNSLVTMHWIRYGKLQELSCKMICSFSKKVVVHSKFLKKNLDNKGLKNIIHIEYPKFVTTQTDSDFARKYWGLSDKFKTMCCIGSTRYDKGLDLLIEALNKVNVPFQLLVAGQERAFSYDYIKEKTISFENQTFLNLRYLTDEEIALAVSASDIVVLPYRKTFNGASGPLVEGVYYKKIIIGPEHGNLGYTISENNLGWIFKSEDIDSLANVLNKALKNEFEIDEKYLKYRDSLTLDCFNQSYNELYKQLVLERNH